MVLAAPRLTTTTKERAMPPTRSSSPKDDKTSHTPPDPVDPVESSTPTPGIEKDVAPGEQPDAPPAGEQIPSEVRAALDEEAHRIEAELAAHDQSSLTPAGETDTAAMGNQAAQRIETFGGDGQTRPWVTIRGATVCFRRGDFGTLQIGTRINAQTEDATVAITIDTDEWEALAEALDKQRQ
jgi:hypothetical protein